MKKYYEWDKTVKCQKAFKEVKKAVTKELVLMLPDFPKAFEVQTNTSNFSIGGVFIQNGHPIVLKA